MLIKEVQEIEVNLPKIIALANFLIGRAEDTGAQKRIGAKAFLELCQHMGIGITQDTLVNLAQQGKLSQVIANVTPKEVIFKGADDTAGETQPSPEQNQAIVAQMAKRAMK